MINFSTKAIIFLFSLWQVAASVAHGAEANKDTRFLLLSVEDIIGKAWFSGDEIFAVETSGYLRKAPTGSKFLFCDSLDDVWFFECLEVDVGTSVVYYIKNFDLKLNHRYRVRGEVGPNYGVSPFGIVLWDVKRHENAVAADALLEYGQETHTCPEDVVVEEWIAGGAMYPLSVLLTNSPLVRNKKVTTAGYLMKGKNSFICRTRRFQTCIRLCGDSGNFESGEKVFVAGIFVESKVPALVLIGSPVNVPISRKWFF